MTKKDYTAIAIAVRGSIDTSGAADANGNQTIMTSDLVNRLSDMLRADNSRFDRERFTRACIGN